METTISDIALSEVKKLWKLFFFPKKLTLSLFLFSE